jgi:hypothetical protein
MPAADDLAALAAARDNTRRREERLRAVEAAVKAAEDEREVLAASGAPASRIDTATGRVASLRAAREEAAGWHREELDRSGALLRRISLAETPEDAVATLDGQVPVALLPLRIETRFAEDRAALHIRVFPDQIHINAHDPELTEVELAFGRTYWERRWTAPADPQIARAAWQAMVGAQRPQRARWVVEATRPSNPLGAPPGPQLPDVPRRAGPWTRPGRAAALPTRWCAIGIRGGQEIFRVWSDAVAETLQVTPGPEDEPVGESILAEGLRWIADPDAARRDGVLLTVQDADLAPPARLAGGLDELLVVGVDWTRSPEDAAVRLRGLLDAHLYTDDLAFLSQGTPTNNTAEEPSGHSSDWQVAADALDPALTQTVDPEWSAGARLTAALGIGDAPSLLGAPGGGSAEHAVASALVDATWEATAGTYLGQLLRPVDWSQSILSDDDIDALRAWSGRHLFSSGPLPILRVARQPYGFLPVLDLSLYRPRPQDRVGALVHATASRLRPWWERAVPSVPRLDGAADLDAALVAILQRTPVCASMRFRRVFPPVIVFNLVGFDDLAEHQQFNGWLVQSMFEGRPASAPLRISTFTTDPRDHALRIPWARPAGLAPDAPLPYVGELRDLLDAAGSRERLATRGNATSLGEALLALSAALELDAAHGRVVRDFARRRGLPTPLAGAIRVPHTDTLGTGLETPAGTGPLTFESPRALAEAVIPELTGSRTVAEHVRLGLGAVIGGQTRPGLDGLRRLAVALDQLRDEPGERVELALRGVLDLSAYRLDAWLTALATERLTDLRRTRPRGVHVGAFGWVEGLRSDPVEQDSLGYVHTPSLTHAVTAAVLRSGHLAHRAAAQQALALDLSAPRVRTALAVLQGVEGGQPLGALLGYRLERGIRERDAVLMRYVLPLRRFAPLRHTDEELEEPVETIAARDVVDGVVLLERWRADGGRQSVLDAVGVLPEHRDGVAVAIDAIDDVLDAVSDALLAETVYQTVRGNQERAGAALAALDHQQRPVDPEVIRTPRSGTTVTHRVLVWLGDEDAPGWEALHDPRSEAEPRLNAWAARLFGSPHGIAFAGEVRRGDTVRRTVSASAEELGLSPLALALAGERAAGDRPSELESRVAIALATKVDDADEEDRLVLGEDPPEDAPSGTWGLAAIRAIGRWLVRCAGSRPATARDLAPLLSDAEPGYDLVELRDRANTALATLVSIRNALLSNADPAVALAQAARLGVVDALPQLLGPGAGLGDQAARVLAALRAALAREREERTNFAARPDPTPEQTVEHHLARLRAVLGQGFPVLPWFRVGEPGGVAASLGDRSALLGGDELASIAWIHQVALVRPSLDPLSALLSATEAAGRDSGLPRVAVVQAPHEPGQRWVALPPNAGEEAPPGRVGIVVHAPAGFDPGAPGAGLVIDEWTESIPASQETTALAFHYDAPAARPPQTVLLAVPATPDAERWSFDALVGTVREAIALTRLRAVSPRELPDLGGYLPALYVPQDVTGDVPSVDLFDLGDRARLPDVVPGVLGKE